MSHKSFRPLAAAATAGLFAAVGLAGVHAATVAPGAGPAITVYTGDLGLVRERRVLEVAGDTVRIPDVPERIDFSSVRLVPEQGRVTRLAYRWDVASGDALLESALGRRVRVVSRGDRVAEGTLMAVDGGWLVVRTGDGAVLNLSRAAVEEVRLTDPPAGLSLRPMLEAVIDGASGRVEAELAYLTGGLSWGAEHTLVRSGETAAKWSTAVTVQNTTGRGFANALLKLVAGEPRRAFPSPPPRPLAGRAVVEMSAAAEKQEDLGEEAFSEYHLYTLDRPATLRDRESQSFTMLAPREIRVTPRYLYRGGDPRGVLSQVQLVNAKDGGPGAPLPAGRVRVYEPDASGAPQFTGEARIKHTAVDEKLSLDVGYAFDLAAERRETESRRISDREREYSVEVSLRNRKKTDARIVIEEGVGGDFDIVKQTHGFTRKDAHTITAAVTVPAGKEVVAGYTVRVRY